MSAGSSAGPTAGAGAPASPPRLAILGCRGIPARYGGFETFAEELAVRLAQRGVEVTVYCEARGAAPAAPSEHRGVRLETVRVPDLGSLGTLLYDLRSLRHARARHDVVYMLGYGAGGFLWLARRSGNRVWVNMDGLEWRRSKWGPFARAWLRWGERAALRQADRIVFDSAAVRDVVLGDAHLGDTHLGDTVLGAASEPKVAVIAYGAELGLAVDPGVLESLGLLPRGYVLAVARIEPENHVLEIVRAHGRARPGTELLVVGDLERGGRYGAACRAAAKPSVRFLGPVFDPLTLFALRQGACAVVHGHSVGGTNPALLEAMAAGVPIVAHANDFNREVLGDLGRRFASEDELVAVLDAVTELSPAERAREGAALRARCAERYTWERIADEYVRLLGPARGAPAPSGLSTRPEPAAPLPARENATRRPVS